MAEAAKSAEDPTVAQVGDRLIHQSEVLDEIRALPGGSSPGAFAGMYDVALRRLVQRAALVEQAQKDGLANNAEVLRHMQEASDQVLEEAYLKHAAGQLVTEGMLLDRYNAEVRGRPGPEQVHGRVILVPTEAQAQSIIVKLAAGADFADLARRFSKDASAERGGDLGFVGRDALGPEVGSVLFALPAGEVTAYPVRTVYGWFVLKVEARRQAPTPSFAEVHDKLEIESERDELSRVVEAALRGGGIGAAGAGGAAADRDEAGGNP